MTRPEFAGIMCIIMAIAMIGFAAWGPHYFNNHMSRPGGRRPTIWLIISLEVILAAQIIQVAEAGFWSAQDIPLALPCLGEMLLITGAIGMFWAIFQLSRLPIQR